MAKVKEVKKPNKEGAPDSPAFKIVGLKFICPGCNEEHRINNSWEFNGDFENPTIKPSVLRNTGHYVNGKKGNCYCDYEERLGEKPPFECSRCHSFITDGQIRFLNDSTHDLAGQTVQLPEIE